MDPRSLKQTGKDISLTQKFLTGWSQPKSAFSSMDLKIIYSYIYMYTYVCLCVFIYEEGRVSGRERETERESGEEHTQFSLIIDLIN